MSDPDQDLTPDISAPIFTAADFPAQAYDQSYRMALALNAYVAAGYNWKPVHDRNIISRHTLIRYKRIPEFQAALDSLMPAMAEKALGVVNDVMDNGNDSDRLKAADKMLQALDSARWDAATRRENARTQGDMANRLFAATLTPERIAELQKLDPVMAKAIEGAIDGEVVDEEE